MLQVLILTVCLHTAFTLNVANIKSTLTKVPEDGRLNFTELSKKYGHQSMQHELITEDGYILRLFNIPGDRRRPVLLVHGIFDNSDGFIIRGKNSLAITLANNGYDVWLMNVRGTRYSRRHTTYNPDSDTKFWDFSLHEFGYYDLPANIDYVLKTTRQPRLSIIGYCQGTTAVFVLTSTRPQYNAKIKVFLAIAPIVFIENTRGPLALIMKYTPWILDKLSVFDIQEVFGHESLTKALINILCTQLSIGYDLCFDGLLSFFSGADPDEIGRNFFPTLIAHYLDGTSMKNLIHYTQIGRRRAFSAYDYGVVQNLKVYKIFYAPHFDLKNVTVDTFLVSGKNDRISTLKDVGLLVKKLRSVKTWKVLESPKFGHMDHMWGKRSPQVLFPYLMDVLRSYNNGTV